MMDGLTRGKVQLKLRGQWRPCWFRDNGDGTALVIVCTGKDKPVTIGNKTYSGKMHTVKVTQIRPERVKVA